MSAAVLLKKNKIKSTEEQSSAIIVRKPKRTATSARTVHTRQNKPYRLGAVRAGVLGARSRCCPAATVPVAVVLPCGVCCCIAHHKQKYKTRKNHQPKKQSSAIIVHKQMRTATSTRTIHTRQNKPYRLGTVPAGEVGARRRCCPTATAPAAVVLSLIHI